MFYQSQNSFNTDVVKFESNVDYNFPAHLHNNFEFINVKSGQMEVIVDKTTYTLNAGDSILVFPNQVHEFVTPKSSSHFLCIFSFCKDDNLLVLCLYSIKKCYCSLQSSGTFE